jgi:ankyrin repeat protein
VPTRRQRKDEKGLTPLLMAAMLKHTPIVEMLLKAGARPSQ